MKNSKKRLLTALALLIAGLLTWGAVEWPLPLHFSKAIPYSELNANISELQPGDHIQLLYHFWLFRDVVAGRTPVFANPWEFNVGDDKVVRQFDPYYLPFSAVYAVVSPWFGNAAGWNAAVLLSIILGIFGLYLLAMRFTNVRWLAFLCAAIGTSLPYRWVTIIGGSPTGFAICLVPWLFYGIDRAVRDCSPPGGVVAGLAIFFAFSSDLHVFYFSALATPLFIAISWLNAGDEISGRRLRRTICALLPFCALALLAVVISHLASGNMESTSMSGGRTFDEVRQYSPIMSALFRRDMAAACRNIYTGIAMVLLCFVALGVVIHSRDRRRIVLASVLIAAALGIYLLSLGVYGPFHAFAIRAARRLIPKYVMIRQPAKVFCLMPTVFVVFVSLSFTIVASRFRKNALLCSMAIFLAAVAFLEHVSFFRVGLCKLPDDMPGYRMVAADNPDAHAMAVTLWPGESHWSSLCEYGAMTSHIKMLNGYSPRVSSSYVSDVYGRIESVNRGCLSNEQADYIMSLGVTHLIFIERPFHPKSSPYTCGVVIARLASNPRLKLIGRDGTTWVFRLVDGKFDMPIFAANGPFAATYHWQEKWLKDTTILFPGKNTYNTKLHGPIGDIQTLRYELLVSGGGLLTNSVAPDMKIDVPIAPTWVTFPFIPPYGCDFVIADGAPVMHHALLAVGQSSFEGDSFTFPAALLQHVGTIDTPGGSVVFDSDKPCHGVALFGPDLPFKSGEWNASIKLSSESDEICGALTVNTFCEHSKRLAYAKTKANGVTSVRFFHDGIRPLRLLFHFNKRIESDRPFPIKVIEVKFEKCDGGQDSADDGGGTE